VRKIRVLVGKPGLDGHDRGAKVVAAALRDAGMEVIYTGLHQTPEQIVDAAVQEDVDVVALSVLSGAHMTLFTDVLEKMKSRGIGDRLLSGGGIIPPEDMEALTRLGVGRLFGPGSSTQDIAGYIRGWFRQATGEEPFAAPPTPLEAPKLPAMSAREHSALHPTPAGSARPKAPAKQATKAAPKKTAKKKLAAPKRKLAKQAAKKTAGKPAGKPAKRKATRPARKPARRRATPKRKPARRPKRR